MGIYAKVDCGLPRDPKLVTAGPLARLLYVQYVLFCRENLTDGELDTVLLPLVALDIPNPKKHIATLVTVGALEESDRGWRIPPEVWAKWNPTKAEVDEMISAKREAGARGNHDRWHVARGQVVAGCEWCASQKDRTVRGVCEPGANRKRSPEGEREGETKKPSLNPLDEQTRGATRLKAEERTSTLEAVAERIADARGLRNRGNNPAVYFARCVQGVIEEVHDQVHDILTEHPDWDAETIARQILYPPRPSSFPSHWKSTLSGTVREEDYV